MRRRIAHLPEILQRADNAAAKVMGPDAIHHDAGGQRILPRGQPPSQREPAAGGVAVGSRNLGGRIAIRGHRDEARLRPAARRVHVAANQEIRGRHFVAAGTRVQVAPFELRPERREVGCRHRPLGHPIRGEAVVAVGHDVGLRQRLGPLLIDRVDLRVERLAPRQVFGRHRLVDLDVDDRALEHLVGEQFLAFGPLGFRPGDGLLDVEREVPLDRFRPQFLPVRRFDLPDLGAQRRLLRVDLRELPLVCVDLLSGRQRIRRFHIPEQRRLQRVIVPLENRIELVIVTAGALECQAQRSLADCRNHVVEVVEPVLGVVPFTHLDPGTQAQERRGDVAIGGLVVQLIARHLFGEEHVVGLVAVERADDVVAIPPDVGPVVVVFVAVGIGVAGGIQPVTSPPLAVVRRGEQRVDQPFPRARCRVGEERRRLIGGRRQADQVEVRPAQRA